MANRWTFILISLIVIVILDITFVFQGSLLAQKEAEYLKVPDDAGISPSKESFLHSSKKQQQQKLLRSSKDASSTHLKKGRKRDSPASSHKVAGLNCDKYGGPSEEIAAEMVYWQDIPQDAHFVSPYRHPGDSPKYLTFEPDEGGWNNIRMSMETAVTLAAAMGRILVMPPEQGFYLLEQGTRQQKKQFTFADFFHFDSVETEHQGIEIISFQEFLEREVLTGKVVDKVTKKPTFPLNNRTDWNGLNRIESQQLAQWVRSFATNPVWSFDKCMVGFPDPTRPGGTKRLTKMVKDLNRTTQDLWSTNTKYINKPTPVDASPRKRLKENLSFRPDLCVYNQEFQDAKVFHLMGDNASGARLLVHFYAYLFFEDWKQDLWTKRFVRDHLRYVDEIQCAAARVVHAVRQKAIENGDPEGNFDSWHIRRGDFQYKDTRISAEEMLQSVGHELTKKSTLYIATDERNRTFFEPFFKDYHVYFLDDFKKEISRETNTNFYGMLDQRIASRGRKFFGCYYSTFTGYIHRMRGYHSQQDKGKHGDDGWKQGGTNSWYYVPKQNVNVMRDYRAISEPMWAREFPVGWRDLDKGIKERSAATARRR